MPRTKRRKFSFRKLEPVPPPPPERGALQAQANALLDLLYVGESLDFDRGRRAVEGSVYRYRVKYGRERRFIVRQMEPGRSKVWRTR